MLRHSIEGRGYTMNLTIAKVFDEYPNPMYIIRPIVKDGICDDFEYIYANKAFCIFLGRSHDELVGHRFLENFGEKGEREWLNLFMQTAVDRKHTYSNNVSMIAGKKMFTETFHIAPDMCGCIIHDFQAVPTYMTSSVGREVRHRANHDYFTGFYNRYYLIEQTDNISRKKNVGIAFVDIFNMKKINDEFGREEGDKVILDVCETIRSYFNEADVFRIVGVEFLVVWQSPDREEFVNAAEECRRHFDSERKAAIGFGYYEEIDSLDDCIKACEVDMDKHIRRVSVQ
jgi:GGDEF domain-containing protein